MGSNSASVGNFYGKPYVTFTAAAQDSGSLGFEEIPPFYKARTFQLLVVSGSGFTITIYGTLDKSTAAGTGGTAWEPIPAPSTESTPAWVNPLTDAPGTRLFYCNAPLAAVRAVSAGGAWTGSCILVILAAS